MKISKKISKVICIFVIINILLNNIAMNFIYATEERTKESQVTDYNTTIDLINKAIVSPSDDYIGTLGSTINNTFLEMGQSLHLTPISRENYPNTMAQAYFSYMVLSTLSNKEYNDISTEIKEKEYDEITYDELNSTVPDAIKKVYELINKSIDAYNSSVENGDSKIDMSNNVGNSTKNDVNSKIDIDTDQVNDNFVDNIDIWTGMILEPVFEFVTFCSDCILSIVSSFITGTQYEAIMQKTIPSTSTGDVAGARITLSTDQYKNALGVIVDVKYPHIKYSPEEIFSGKIDLLSIDFISGKIVDNQTGELRDNNSTGWNNLRVTIASWYKVLRMVAIVALLLILIYTGIKLILSANSSDKAKYKERIINWFIAIVILFSMHYIMAFIIAVVQNITELFQNSMGNVEVHFNNQKFVTNLMGLARFQMQQQAFSKKIMQLIIYVALITLTIKFTIKYIKRMINIAFLTLIAPIVACTYPIEKMNDSKAQGFQMWLTEYIFNSLLQLMHLIMYIVLMNSALTLAVKNPIYAIAVLLFMSQAEKIFKKIFGFHRAKGGMVSGAMEAIVTTSLANSLIKNITGGVSRFVGANGNSGIGKSKVSNNFNDNFYIPTKEDTNIESWIEDSGEELNYQRNQSDNNKSGNNVKIQLNTENDIDELRKKLQGTDWSSVESPSPVDMKSLYNMIDSKYKKIRKPKKSGSKRDTLRKEIKELKDAMKVKIQENEDRLKNRGISLRYKDTHANISTEELLNMMVQASANGHTDTAKQYFNIINSRMNENDIIFNSFSTLNVENENEEVHKEDFREDKKENKVGIFNTITKTPVAGGVINIGKQIVKPVWDTKKSATYNGKRLANNVARLAVGTTAGLTAAAVQAGISITDGQYKPWEGAMAFGAGYASANSVMNRGGAALSNVRTPERRLRDHCNDWYDRDDVIQQFEQKYQGRAREMRKRARDNYVSRGITDFSEQKKGLNYADYLLKEKRISSVEEADKLSIATLQYRQELISYGNYDIMFDDAKRDKFIDKQIDKYKGTDREDKARATFREFIKNVEEFDKVNN